MLLKNKSVHEKKIEAPSALNRSRLLRTATPSGKRARPQQPLAQTVPTRAHHSSNSARNVVGGRRQTETVLGQHTTRGSGRGANLRLVARRGFVRALLALIVVRLVADLGVRLDELLERRADALRTGDLI